MVPYRVHSAANDTAQGIPGAVIEPVPQVVETLLQIDRSKPTQSACKGKPVAQGNRPQCWTVRRLHTLRMHALTSNAKLIWAVPNVRWLAQTALQL